MLTATVVAFSACKSDKKSALDFNNKLSAISDSLYTKGVGLGKKIQSGNISGDYSALANAGKDMAAYVTGKITEVKDMKDVGGSEKFKQAMLDFLEYEKNICTEAIGPFTSLNASSTPEQKKAAMDNLISKSKEEEQVMMKVRDEQSKYAEKNGFKIEPKKKLTY